MLQDSGRQGVVFSELFKHFFIGRWRTAWRLFDHRQAQLGKKYVANLLGAAKIEHLAGQLMRLGFQLQNAQAQLAALFGQHRRVNQHAVALDAVQAFAAFDFKLVDKPQLVVGFNLRPQHAVHVQRLVRVFA